MNSNYRYQLERYRGRGTRYTCPQCGRKYTFTRYIDTENNNQYISERVGKCNRLDKCGYHYTPREYFADNPWLKEERNECSFIQNHRENERMNANTPPRPTPPKPKVSVLADACIKAIPSEQADTHRVGSSLSITN